MRMLAACLVAASFARPLAVVAQEAAPAANAITENRIYIGQPDGSGMKPLVEIPDYTMQGSPSWSPDGQLIAFDAWRPKLGETSNESKIIVVNADGTNPRVLGDGAMPSFSPRHNRIAFSRYQPNYGVWVMSSEGPDKELVLLDEEGWGAEWSPDGKQIVYTVYDQGPNGQGVANFAVFDLVEGDKTKLFEDGKSGYNTFFWNFAWSPDGKRIVFKGQRADDGNKYEVNVVDARGAKHGLVTRLQVETPPNYSWSHDSKLILFSQKTPDRGGRVQLYTMLADGKEPPQLLPGQDPQLVNASGAFSPDGKRLLVVSRQPPPKNNAAKGKAKKKA